LFDVPPPPVVERVGRGEARRFPGEGVGLGRSVVAGVAVGAGTVEEPAATPDR
jgi:hypothetical protein